MTQLSSTLSRAWPDLAGFFIMFFIVFFAFAQLGLLLFGNQIESYSTFDNAIFTLLRIVLGDFDFPEMEEAHRLIGPTFFISYVFFVFFVILNMFLAIINDTYSVVKVEIDNSRNEVVMGDYFKRGYNNMKGKMGERNRDIDIETALKVTSYDGVATFQELRQNLKKLNFSDMEIEMFFVRYDTDGDFEFNKQEMGKILDDLDHDRLDRAPAAASKGDITRPRSGVVKGSARSDKGPDSEGRGNVSIEEFNVLTKRVSKMETGIGSIVTKIDAVLVKLEKMELQKHKRKAAMTRIMGTINESDGADDAAKRKQMEDLVRGELDTWSESSGSRPSTG